MAKLFPRVWEAFKSLLILLLAVSAFYLTYQLLVGSGTISLSSPTASSPLSSAAPQGSVGVPRPIRMAVTTANGRHGVQYDDDAVDELFDDLAPTLGEALSSADEPIGVSRAEWEQALQRPGIYFHFPGSVPLSLITRWLGGTRSEAPLTDEVSHVLLAEDAAGSQVRLYYQTPKNGLYYSCTTALAFSGLLDSYIPNGATFAFLLGEAYSNLPSDTLLLVDPPAPPIYLASGGVDFGVSESRLAFLNALNFNPQSNAVYPSADGWSVRDGNDSLRLTASGTVVYHSAGDNRYPVPENATRTDLVELTGELVRNAVSPYCGSARVYLSGITSSPDTVTLTYAYTLSGAELQLGTDGWCAQFTVGNGQILEFTLHLRRYTPSAQTAFLLPEYQAMAAMDAMDLTGHELVLRYYDGGSGSVAPAWIAR